MFLVKVCRVLKKYDIPYAIVGGHAVNLHGVVRGTIDVDFILKWTKTNIINCEKALNEIGLISRVPLKASELFKNKKKFIEEKNLIAWNFINPTNYAEQIDIIITVDLKNKATVNKRIKGFDVKVISKKGLIAMKKKSAREQDLIDVDFLERI